MVAELTPEALLGWVAAYERAWRDPHAHPVSTLFAPDAEYLVEPYAEPVTGLAAIEALWSEESDVRRGLHDDRRGGGVHRLDRCGAGRRDATATP